MQLPNAAWRRLEGEVVRPVDGGLWYARANGLMPIGSILSIRRQGLVVNGGWVMEADVRGLFFRPWSSEEVRPGDTLKLESVAPKLP